MVDYMSSAIVKDMPVKKICCLGPDQAGVPICAVIAFKCPEIRVTVVNTNPEQIFLWNANRISGPAYGPGLIELVKKCHNKNLFFSTNEKDSIKEADIIFIASKSKLKTYGEGKDKVVDMSVIGTAADSVAEFAETDKIVVEKSHIPIRTSEFIRRILKNKCRPGVSLQILSNPQFYDEGNPIHQLLFPDRILIGSDATPEGLSAAKELSCVYQRWVLPQKTVILSNWTAELSKIVTCAFAVQKLVSIQALSSICEETGANIGEVARILSTDSRIGSGPLNTCLSLGKSVEVILNLIYMCECMSLHEIADYWRQVLEMNEFHQERFTNRLSYALCETGTKRSVAVFGFAYYKDTMITTGSPSITVCRRLLDERAIINIFDPNVTKSQVIQDLKSRDSEHPQEYLEKVISVFVDPYRAVSKCQLLVICTTWPEFSLNLDFERIFDDMTKPAYIFESGNILNHSQLVKLGFRVYTVGKLIKNSLMEPKPANSQHTSKI